MISTKLALLLGLDAAAVAAIMVGSRRWLKVRHEWITSAKLQRPLRILFFSDLHGNNRYKMNLDVWKKIGQIPGVDIAIIAGDVIISRASEILPHLSGIGQLARRVPTYYVDGNHDVRDYNTLKRLFTQRGVNVLADNRASLIVNGAKVDITGLRDYKFHKETGGFVAADAAMTHLDPSSLNICTSHQPQIFDRYPTISADLILCGHTHGGQVRLPFTPVLFAPNQGLLPRYGYGWCSIGGEEAPRMFVTKGVGTTHFPIRFWNRPEICVIDILPYDKT